MTLSMEQKDWVQKVSNLAVVKQQRDEKQAKKELLLRENRLEGCLQVFGVEFPGGVISDGKGVDLGTHEGGERLGDESLDGRRIADGLVGFFEILFDLLRFYRVLGEDGSRRFSQFLGPPEIVGDLKLELLGGVAIHKAELLLVNPAGGGAILVVEE